MADAIDRLRVLLDSSTPIVVMETVEESRAVRLVRLACQGLNLASFEWTIASGLVRSGMAGSGMAAGASAGDFGIEHGLPPGGYSQDAYAAAQAQGNMIYDTRDPAKVLGHMEGLTVEGAFILKDFHRHLEDPVGVRRLRDVGQKFQTNRRTLILTAPSIQIPPELAGLVEYLELPLPDRARLREIVEEMLVSLSKTHTLGRKLDAAGIEAVVANLRGLTEEESERAVSQALVMRFALCPETITDILDAKKAMLKRTGMLDFVDTSDSMAGIGGLDKLKNWVGLRPGALGEKARDFGLEPPKGVIILRVQSCGKSLCARAIAGEWKLPLVKFNSAAIFDKYIGETEKRIQKVFKVAERLAPCVLWTAELEKVFAGSGADSASADAGVSSRLLAAFLSWMQDRKAPVFVAATCNHVAVLPPELIRQGRFYELVFVYLPDQVDRQ